MRALRMDRVFVALAAMVMAGLGFAAAPAQAAPLSGASPSARTLTVGMTTLPAGRETVAPDGQGPRYTLNCGTAQLTVTASNRQYLLVLNSSRGAITWGSFTISTDGFLSVPNPPRGVVTGRALSSNAGSVLIPGINVHNAFAGGTVLTSDGSLCFFVVNAPWN